MQASEGESERAPRATVMRRREALALLPVLPPAVDLVHLLVEM